MFLTKADVCRPVPIEESRRRQTEKFTSVLTCVRNRDESPDALTIRRSRIHFAALDLLKACRDPRSARNDSSASWPEGDDNLRDSSRSSTTETPWAISGPKASNGRTESLRRSRVVGEECDLSRARGS